MPKKPLNHDIALENAEAAGYDAGYSMSRLAPTRREAATNRERNKFRAAWADPLMPSHVKACALARWQWFQRGVAEGLVARAKRAVMVYDENFLRRDFA